MNLTSLIQLLQNKVSVLQSAKGQAYASGDLNQYNAIDTELLETQNTLIQLGTLSEIAKAAESINSSLIDVAQSGINAVQDTTIVQGPSASAVINGYDISAYATDPLYESKIQNILNIMPVFQNVGDLDSYIQNIAQGSPVTGAMVYAATQQYAVDLPLMVAIMQNDSCFGTLGIGSTTCNPGNVGNTGSAIRPYSSWQDGVSAVADWLNRHRVVVPATENQPAPIITPIDPASVGIILTDTTSKSSTTSNDVPYIIPIPPILLPSEIIPTTPIIASTTNATFVIPTANATTTPIVDLTSTTTPNIILEPTDSSIGTTTDATTTDFVVPPESTTIPEVIIDTTSTQATKVASRSKRKIV